MFWLDYPLITVKSAVFLLAVLVTALLVPAGAGAQDDVNVARAAVQAAQADVDAAQQAANLAAERYFAAIDQLEFINVEVAEIETEIASASSVVADATRSVRDLVVSQYVDTMKGPQSVDLDDINRHARGRALTRIAANVYADSVDIYRAARDVLTDLEQRQSQLRGEQEALVAELDASQIEANDNLELLTELTATLQTELDRAEEAERLRLEEEARKAAEEAERIAAEQEAQRQAEAARIAAEQAANQPTPVPVAQPTTTPGEPTTEPQETSTPVPTSPPVASTGWVCPVAGPTSFIDSWGAPRVSGRWHKGTDMMANTGTPVVAVASGTVEHRGNRVGGLSAHLMSDTGDRYYYTHLDGYENVGAGWVAQGTVIGYVGMSGNAPVPHLHFEFHPGNGDPINPYPTLIATC